MAQVKSPFRLYCDICEKQAPNVVGPILIGSMKWREMEVSGTFEGRNWKSAVLICPDHPEHAVEGENTDGPFVSLRGGKTTEPEWED